MQENNLFKLKVKIKSLAAEAKIIREMELKGKPIPLTEDRIRPSESIKDGHKFNTQKKPKIKRFYPESVRNSLYAHRTLDVRHEARSTQIAYAFLRGIPLSKVEAKPVKQAYGYGSPNWIRVFRIVEKYGNGTETQYNELLEWIKEHIEKDKYLYVPKFKKPNESGVKLTSNMV